MAKNLSRESLEAIRHMAIGTHDSSLATFDEEAFEKNWHVFTFMVSGFVRRFCLREFHIVKGDPLIAMVASEIWRYNITRTLLRDGALDTTALSHEGGGRDRLARCNAYSIAQHLGIPPETVRRKVKALIEMGWVDRSNGGQLAVTKACEDAFYPESNVETMRDFLSTARHLFKAMELTIASNDETAGAPRRQDHAS